MQPTLKLIIVVIFLLLISCAAPAGGLRPTPGTLVGSYLKNFPLDTVTEAEMIAKVGPPENTLEIEGNKAFIYRLGNGFGKRSYTYIFNNGVVADVRYNDNGPYNGITAREEQGR